MKTNALVILTLLSCSTYADIHNYIVQLKEEKKAYDDDEVAIYKVQSEIFSNFVTGKTIDVAEEFPELDEESGKLNLDIEGEILFNQLFSEEFIRKLESASATETGGRPCGVIHP